jgi:DNA-binding MarR family transcriptional regulator
MRSMLQQSAYDILEIAPQIMQSIRVEMRSRRTPELSVPQFRALTFVRRNTERSLSDLAEHLGLTLPSASKLIDGLVKQGYIIRRESSVDRRRLTLALTAEGERLLCAAREGTQAHLTEILKPLPEKDLEIICRAMELLRPLFMTEPES